MSVMGRLALCLGGGVLLIVGALETVIALGLVSVAGYGADLGAAVAGIGLGLLRYAGPAPAGRQPRQAPAACHKDVVA